MPAILRLLQRDHTNISRLLRVLEGQLPALEAGDPVDYDLIVDILDYCRSFPDRYHHPLEDRVLEALQVRDSGAAAEVGDLAAQHATLAAETNAALTLFLDARKGAEVSRGDLVRSARDFLAHYQRHIETEDGFFFPAAEKALREQDWQDIENAWVGPADPVFGDREEEHYRRLRREVLTQHSPANTA